MIQSKERIKELEAKISELREAIVSLEDQIKVELDKDQHLAIDTLENYINAVDGKFTNFKSFLKYLVDEVRGK